MRGSVLLAIATSAAVMAGCGTDGGPEPVNPDKRIFEAPPGDVLPGTEPTPPPAPIFLVDIASDDGTNVSTTGECLGFTIKTTEYEWAPDAKVTLGPLGTVPVLFRNQREIRVGDAATGYRCFWTAPFGPIGTWDLTITSGGTTWTVEDAITMNPLKIFDLGLIDGTRTWSMSVLDEPDANVFERPYDVDVYQVNVLPALDPTSHVFSHTEFFATGGVEILPVMEFWDPGHTAAYLGRGGNTVIFPKREISYVIVKDTLGAGEPGATYELASVRKQSRGTTPSDDCYDVPVLRPETNEAMSYYTSYTAVNDDFDPNFACPDSTYGTGFKAPGNDGVWRITIPAGKTLRVSTYDDKIDPVTYMIPVPTVVEGTSGCPRRINNCVAAAGRFGGGNTDTMIYRNLTGADEEYFLIFDSVTLMTNEDSNTFLLNVEVYDR